MPTLEIFLIPRSPSLSTIVISLYLSYSIGFIIFFEWKGEAGAEHRIALLLLKPPLPAKNNGAPTVSGLLLLLSIFRASTTFFAEGL